MKPFLVLLLLSGSLPFLAAQPAPVADAMAKLQQAKEAEADRHAKLLAAQKALADAQKAKAESLTAAHKALDEAYGEGGSTKPVARSTVPGSTVPEPANPNSAALETARSGVVVVIAAGADGKEVTSAATLVARDRLLTSYHSIDGARKVRVRFRASAEQTAEVIAIKPSLDLALLKVDSGNRIPLVMGNTPIVGERIYVISSPFGLTDTVTAGIVSALNRDVDVPNGSGGTVKLTGVIQTDASISPGSSGGAMVNTKGEVLGIATAIRTGEDGRGIGLNFVNPISNAIPLLKGVAGSWVPLPQRFRVTLVAYPRTVTPVTVPPPQNIEETAFSTVRPRTVDANSTSTAKGFAVLETWLRVVSRDRPTVTGAAPARLPLHSPIGHWYCWRVEAGRTLPVTVTVGGATRQLALRAGEDRREEFR